MRDRFTYAELVACIMREIAQRERVYPRLVEKGTMKPEEAGRQTAMMKNVLAVVESAASILTECDRLTDDQREALREDFGALGHALERLSHTMPEEAQEALF